MLSKRTTLFLFSLIFGIFLAASNQAAALEYTCKHDSGTGIGCGNDWYCTNAPGSGAAKCLATSLCTGLVPATININGCASVDTCGVCSSCITRSDGADTLCGTYSTPPSCVPAYSGTSPIANCLTYVADCSTTNTCQTCTNSNFTLCNSGASCLANRAAGAVTNCASYNQCAANQPCTSCTAGNALCAENDSCKTDVNNCAILLSSGGSCSTNLCSTCKNSNYTKCSSSNICIANKTCPSGQTFDPCAPASNYCTGTANSLKIGYDSLRTDNFLFNSSLALPSLTIPSSGYIGVGITNPNFKLHISSSSDEVINIGGGKIGGLDLTPLNNDQAASKYYVDNNFLSKEASSSLGWLLSGNTLTSDNNWLGSINDWDVSFRTNNIERMRILKGGNIGIGTSTSNNTIIKSGNDNDVLNILYQSSSRVLLSPNAYSAFGTAYGSNGSAGIRLGDGTNFSYLVGNGTNLLLNPVTGNVGIGTTNPLAKLQVEGNIMLAAGSGTLGSGNYRAIGIPYNNTNWTGGGANIQFWQGGNNANSNYMTFNTNDSGVSSGERMRLTETGRLGIGTTAPGAKFEVASSTAKLLFDPSGPSISAPNSTEINLQANGQNIFRGLDNWNQTWSDSVVASYFQVGRSGGNTAFSAYSGSTFNRLAFITNKFQVTNNSGSITPPTNFFQIDYNNTNLFSVQSTGYVGIGSSTPNYKLSFATTTSEVMNLGGGQIGGLASTPTRNDMAVPLGYLKDNYSATSSSFWGGSLGGNIYSANTSNVGVGTTNPKYGLEVQKSNIGIASTTASLDLSNAPGYYFDDASWYYAEGYRLVSSKSDNSFAIQQKAPLLGAINTRLFIKNDGNVGIGTTNPGVKLDVTGSIRTSNQLISTVAAGTAPFSVISSTTVTNLTANYLGFGSVGSAPSSSPFAKLTAGIIVLPEFGAESGAITIRGWNSSYYSWQIIGNNTPWSRPELYFRTGPDGSWGTTFKLWHSGNLTNNLSTSSVVKWNGSSLANSVLYDNGTNIGIGSTTPSVKLSFGTSTVEVINVGGGQIGGLASTPTRSDMAVPLGYLQANYNATSSSFWGGSLGGNIYSANTLNVGIGTTTPASRLQIGSVGSTGYSVSNGLAFGDGTRAGALNVDSSGTTLYSSTNLILSPGTTEALRILANGNVGIGTTTPQAKFHVSGDDEPLSDSYSGVAFIGAGTSKVQIGYSTATTPGYGWISATKNPSTWSNLVLMPNGQGNVGIGTTTPSRLLDVNGIMRISNYYSEYYNNGTYAGKIGAGYWVTTPGNSNDMSLITPGSFYVGTGGNAVPTNFVFKNDGRFGIGSSTPNYKLSFATTTIEVINVGGGQIGGLASVPLNSDQAVSLGYLQANYNPTSTSFWAGNLSGNIYSANTSNVGIGTTTPGARLHIAVPTTGTKLIIDDSYTTNGKWGFAVGIPSVNDTTFRLRHESSNLDVLSALMNGNVGIGTTTPSQLLTVGNNNQFTVSSAGQVSMASYLYGTGSSNVNRFVFNNSGPSYMGISGGSAAGNINSIINLGYTANPSTYLTPVLSVSDNGSVGIGSSTPSIKLSFATTTIEVINVGGGQIGGLASTPTRKDMAVPLGYLEANYTSTSTAVTTSLWGGSQSGNIYSNNGANNVGIGTTTPDVKFQVYGTTGRIATFGSVGASTALATPVNVSFGSTYGNSTPGSVNNLKWDLFTSASSGSRYGIGMSSNLMEFQSGPNGGLGFFVNQGTEAMRILSSGNVGIGTTDIAAKLDVRNLLSTSTPALSLLGGGTYGSGYQMAWGNYSKLSQSSSGMNYITWGAYNDGATWRRSYGGAVAGLVNLQIGNGNYFSIQTDSQASPNLPSWTDVLTVNGTNVGIGTTNPLSQLQVSGVGLASFTGTTKGLQNLEYTENTINHYSAIDFQTSYAQTSFRNPAARVAMKLTPVGSLLQFGTSNSWASGITNTAMTIDYNGYIGIGTTTPDRRLSITGFDGTTGDILTVNGGRIRGLNLTTIYPDEAVSRSFLESYVSEATSTISSVPKFRGVTTQLYTGNMGGYLAANTICSNTVASSSHVCTSYEILNTINSDTLTIATSSMWISNGPPGFTSNSNDCMGWTSTGASDYGAIWHKDATNGQGYGSLTGCYNSRNIACCK
ncbi:MAG: beta strand repeat-containing protein [Patescibacteria group bacterium]